MYATGLPIKKGARGGFDFAIIRSKLAHDPVGGVTIKRIPSGKRYFLFLLPIETKVSWSVRNKKGEPFYSSPFDCGAYPDLIGVASPNAFGTPAYFSAELINHSIYFRLFIDLIWYSLFLAEEASGNSS